MTDMTAVMAPRDAEAAGPLAAGPFAFDGCESSALKCASNAPMNTFMQSGIRTRIPIGLFCAILAIGAASSTPAAMAQSEPPAARDATEEDAALIYDRIGEDFRTLERELFEGLSADSDDPQAMFLATGIADARMARWLKAARVLGDDLIAASQLPYQRVIDPQDGFALGPAHLAPLRTTIRALALLVRDAALNGDRDRLADLLRAQITIAIRTAGDGTLPSSISSINAVQEHTRTVDGLLDCGVIDAATARALLEIRAPLAMIQDFGTVAATRAELDALQTELDRILLTPSDERPAAVAGLRVSAPIRLDDSALLAARGGAQAYMTDVAEALGEADFAAGRRRLAIAEQRLREGAFGDLLKVLAPQLLPTAELLSRTQGELEAQRAVLDMIARGESKPAMHANAGWYYQKASRATMRLSLEAQGAIDAIRTSEDSPTTATVSDARRAINACRESVINPIMLASMSERCSLPHHPAGAAGSGLVRSCADGINGAVRVVLADAFGAGTRPAGSPTRAEAATACLRVAARFAAIGSYSHSLVAHQVVRDLKQPLKQLQARGELTPAVRNELAAILDQMSESDPLGFAAAVESERAWLGGRSFPSGSSSVVAFEATQLESLTPNQIGFLLAMFTEAQKVPFDAPRGGPLDGALVDVRSWFDLAAFKRAYAQFETVRSRAQQDAAKRNAENRHLGAEFAEESESAIAWLDVTSPVDIEARIQSARLDWEPIVQIVAAPDRGARPQANNARTR
jgi:hypothetical protein